MDSSIILVIFPNRKYKDNQGKEFCLKMFFIELPNKQRIAIQPSFKEDFEKLKLISKIEYNDSLAPLKNNEKKS